MDKLEVPATSQTEGFRKPCLDYGEMDVPAAPQIEGVRKTRIVEQHVHFVPATPQIEGVRKRSDATRCRTEKGCSWLEKKLPHC